MDILKLLFYPDFGVESFRYFWAVVNAFFYIIAITVPTFLLFHCCFSKRVQRRKHIIFPGTKKNGKAARRKRRIESFKLIYSKEGFLSFGIVFSVYFFLGFLHFFVQNETNKQLPVYKLFETIYNLLNPVLNLEKLLDIPWYATPGFNFMFRGILILAFAYIVYIFGAACYRASHDLKKFAREMIEKLIRKELKNDKESDSPIVKFFKRVMVVALGLGGGAVATNAEATKGYVQPFLEWLNTCIKTVMEITNFPVKPDSALDLMYGFFVVLMCVCFVLILATIFISFAYLLKYLVLNTSTILKAIKDNWPIYLSWLLALLAFALAGAALFVFVTEYDAIREKIAQFIAASPDSFIAFVTGLVRFAIKLCLLIILVFFIMILWCFVKEQLKRTIDALSGSEKMDRIMSAIMKSAIVLIPTLLIIGIVLLYYDGIAAVLQKIFMPGAGGVAIGWLFAHSLAVFALALLVVTAVMFLVAIFIASCKVLFEYYHDSSEPLKSVMGGLFLAIIGLIPIITNFILEIGKQFKILGKLCSGFKTEREKNSALFVAACFTSIASFLNTFLGLYEFNSSKGNAIPGITSFTIAGGVQLAMLIIGMRAGQYLAERMISDSKSVGANVARAIAKKTLFCLLYFIGIITVYICLFRYYDYVFFFFGWSLVGQVLCAISTVIIVYMTVLQALDIKQLKKHQNNQSDDSFVLEKPKRVGALVCFVVYISLMVVSSGFAFNNLFGRYADDIDLHEQTFDQIQIETDALVDTKLIDILNDYGAKESILNSKLTSFLQTTLDNQNCCRNGLVNIDYNSDTIFKALTSTGIDNETAAAKTKRWHYDAKEIFFSKKALSYSELFKGILMLVGTDYDLIGQEAVLSIYNSEDNISVTISNTTLGDIRFGTPPKGLEPREIRCADKYKILTELLEECFTYAQEMDQLSKELEEYDNEIDLTDFQNVPEDDWHDLTVTLTDTDTYRTDLLDAIASLSVYDNIRLSFLKLYKEIDMTNSGTYSMQDLTWLIDDYLDKCETNARETTPEMDKGTKKENYAGLSGYIEGALKLTDILNSANRLTDTADTENIKTIRSYLNYATGLTNSDFQISYDTLLKGGFEMRPDNNINALDRSWAVAIFILIICILVDLMAFFSGLLLFQNAFLLDMKNNATLKRLGYISYDAALTDYFEIPEATNDNAIDRRYRLAVIYYLLHCNDAYLSKYVVPQFKGIKYELLMPMIEQAKMFLDGYGISDQDPDFHRWLMCLVQDNGVSFDDILPT